MVSLFIKAKPELQGSLDVTPLSSISCAACCLQDAFPSCDFWPPQLLHRLGVQLFLSAPVRAILKPLELHFIYLLEAGEIGLLLEFVLLRSDSLCGLGVDVGLQPHRQPARMGADLAVELATLSF